MRGLTVLLVALAAVAVSGQTYPSGNFLEVQTGAYELRWDSNATHIRLQIKANTLGYVALGFPEPTSGSMPGADMLVAWVDSAGAHVNDYYAMGKYTPLQDDCNNWVVIGGQEAAGWTTVDVVRVLDTGDSQDRPVPGDMAKLIWAFSPTGSDAFGYHDTNRGPFGAPLLGPVPDELLALQNDNTVFQFDFLNDGTRSVGPNETVYRDTTFVIPNTVQSVHIVGVEHLVQANTSQYVHHFVLYGCNNGVDCDVLWAWAPGGVPFVLPAAAGIRVGFAETYNTLKMNTHYDNPLNHVFYDNSGLRLYVTTVFRPNDAVAFQIGDFAITNPNNIPVGASDLSYEYDCPGSCTSSWTSGVTAFQSFLHMHELGQQIWLSHWRNGQFLGDLDRIDFWDFAFQSNTKVNNVQILPGDDLRLTCTFTNPRGTSVPFQDASEDEMCLVYLYVYPPPDTGTACGYVYLPGVGNTTVCNAANHNVFNPTARDPPSMKARTFGVAPGAGYTCPAGSSTTGTSSTANSVGPGLNEASTASRATIGATMLVACSAAMLL